MNIEHRTSNVQHRTGKREKQKYELEKQLFEYSAGILKKFHCNFSISLGNSQRIITKARKDESAKGIGHTGRVEFQ